MWYADASFLVSAFLGDDHATGSWRWWQTSRHVLIVSRLALFEAENAIRAAPHCGKSTQADSHAALQGLSAQGWKDSLNAAKFLSDGSIPQRSA
jgi:hypothetical protein